jgi:formate dehydrogenase subunit delta
MDTHHLVSMANQIGSFHASLPNRADALKGTANHIRRFWDPRMRRALLEHIDSHGGEGLDPLVLEAIRANRADLTPPPARKADRTA